MSQQKSQFSFGKERGLFATQWQTTLLVIGSPGSVTETRLCLEWGSSRLVGKPAAIQKRPSRNLAGGYCESAWRHNTRIRCVGKCTAPWSFSVVTRPKCRDSCLQITRKRKQLISRQSTQVALRCLLIRRGKATHISLLILSARQPDRVDQGKNLGHRPSNKHVLLQSR